jgi:hypothetical protein
MLNRLSREELIDLVTKIVECEGSEEEIDNMIEIVKRNVSYPNLSDLIYWSEDDLTPEQIIDTALNYKPIQL